MPSTPPLRSSSTLRQHAPQQPRAALATAPMDDMRQPRVLGGTDPALCKGSVTDPQSHPLPNLAHPNPAVTASPVYAPPTKSTTRNASYHAPPLWKSKEHVRRFHNLLLTLDAACAALRAQGIDFEVARHKGSSQQSHGRWALVGKHFNIHPGFKNNDSKQGPPPCRHSSGRPKGIWSCLA